VSLVTAGVVDWAAEGGRVADDEDGEEGRGLVDNLGEGKVPGREVDSLIGIGKRRSFRFSLSELPSFVGSSAEFLSTGFSLSVTSPNTFIVILISGLDFGRTATFVDGEGSPSAGASEARRDHSGRVDTVEVAELGVGADEIGLDVLETITGVFNANGDAGVDVGVVSPE
jgi:hypothetical protein